VSLRNFNCLTFFSGTSTVRLSFKKLSYPTTLSGI